MLDLALKPCRGCLSEMISRGAHRTRKELWSGVIRDHEERQLSSTVISRVLRRLRDALCIISDVEDREAMQELTLSILELVKQVLKDQDFF